MRYDAALRGHGVSCGFGSFEALIAEECRRQRDDE
jgi:hypothetical protein